MVSRWIRPWYGKLLRPLLEFLARLGITPNELTVGSLILVALAGLLFALDQLTVGLVVLLLGAFLDGIDGALAHVTGLESPFGAFLDSICDHCGDFAVYLGLLWHYLRIGAQTEIILIFIAMFGSVFGSQVRSRAGMVGIDTKTTGAFTRFERIVVLVVGLLVQRVDLALWILATFNSASALQRIAHTVRIYRENTRVAQSQEIS